MGTKLSDIQNPALREQIRQAYDQHVRQRPVMVAGVSDAVAEPDHGLPLERVASAEGGGAGRVKVRLVRYATRLLDADNFAGGCKYLIDALRHAGFIVNDDPASIALSFDQVKVDTKADEGTEILITKDL